jgi:type VI secretion system protein ImpG
VVQQQLAGIVSLDHRITKAWLRFPQGASYLQGVEVRLTIDEAAFERCSVFVFAQVLEQVFAFYAQEGSFTQLVVLDAAGQERVRCGARAGSGLPV